MYKVIQIMTPEGQEGVLMASKLNNSFEELIGYIVCENGLELSY